MIIEWIFSLLLLYLLPTLFCLFNPFFLPVASYVIERKSFVALFSAYISGLGRDIFLATPRFGMLGASSLFSTLVVLSVCFYFSLEGFLGLLCLTTLLTLCDLFFSAILGTIFCGHVFFSWKAAFFALIFSSLWASLVRGIPVLFLFLRRRRRDTNS
jgi:hypothetical protein